jgi:hypothetical protein
MSFSYQWKRNGVAIRGATGSTYTITEEDATKIISCDVTNTNGMGSTTVSSSNPQTLPPLTPVNTSAPVISGTARVGFVLSLTSNGTWNSPEGVTYTYRWRRDNIAISGATSSTYTLVTADLGKVVDCLVKATNSYGFTESDSNNKGPITT